MRVLLPFLLLSPAATFAADSLPGIGGIPIDFILFALTLLGVALFHHATLYVALTGLVSISLYKIIFTGFASGPGLTGFVGHLGHEWVTIANLFCLLTGFALLARHFEKSHVPVILPKYLPNDWKGGFVMLVMVFVISSFLDNIAAALIGAAICALIFRVNLPLAMFVTLYTNPFTIVPLYIVAYEIGRFAIGESSGFIAPPAFTSTDLIGWTNAMQVWMLAAAKPLAIGLVLLASGLAIVGYIATRAAWRLYLIAAWRRRQTLRSGSGR